MENVDNTKETLTDLIAAISSDNAKLRVAIEQCEGIYRSRSLLLLKAVVIHPLGADGVAASLNCALSSVSALACGAVAEAVRASLGSPLARDAGVAPWMVEVEPSTIEVGAQMVMSDLYMRVGRHRDAAAGAIVEFLTAGGFVVLSGWTGPKASEHLPVDELVAGSPVRVIPTPGLVEAL